MQRLTTSLSLIAAVCCLLFAPISHALEGISLQIGSLNFDELTASDIELEFGLAASGLTLNLTVPSLKLTSPVGVVKQLNLKCQTLKLYAEHARCQQGQIRFQHKQLGKQNIRFVITAQPNAEYYQLQLKNIRLAKANIDADVLLHQQQWQLSASSLDASLKQVIDTLEPYLSEQQNQQISNWDIDAKTKITIDATGKAAELAAADIHIDLSELAVSEPTGLYVAEEVAANIKADIKHSKQQYRWNAQVAIANGQAYVEPVFFDFVDTAITVDTQGAYQLDSTQLLIDRFKLEQDKVLTVLGSYQGASDLSGKLDITLAKKKLNTLYQHWLQPFLINAGFDELELAGELTLELTKQQDTFSIQTALYDVFIDDQQNRFGVYQLNGELAWTNQQQPLETSLEWQGGYLFQLPFGRSQLNGQVSNERFVLIDSWTQPILDGQLTIQQFELLMPQQGEPEWSFGAELMPISMTQLTSTFGWPTMNGKLSGVIPKVTYANHQIDIDGALKVNLFEGATVIKDLRLTDPFGSLPQLYANVALSNLDLETLTSTFDFGKITGKLDGRIDDLRLANWQPVAFDAAFYTPEGDESRRRISQQAVNNLSEVSGGASALLSRSFLRFFENFSYKQLGLSCKLVNDVCEMDGIKSAENGYYLVEGGGFPPQINVMGFTRRVNWPDLLERLKAVSNADGVVVE